ncbi:hypothetical protein AVEN_61002-1 [Araneus ventricosus]|uniref:Uncharacterized protein n=1 Tax=Araneus ventricosus TaxID=182803 RepID=A0A4Y2DF59_ARAVE|nr:hypothetical protein AVEN_61002-1 [Araneus ventricosus]
MEPGSPYFDYATPTSVTAKDLSKDQKYLSDISYAVLTGSSDPSRRDPGPTSHARWLTTANRILRLYVGTLFRADSTSALYYAGILHIMVQYQNESFLYKWIKAFGERNQKLEFFIRRSEKGDGSCNFSQRFYGTSRKPAAEHVGDAFENLLFAGLSRQEDLLPQLNVVTLSSPN